ncbi:MAG: class I SAM-dependent methyltransferase [Rhodothermaceae bacterium]
MQHKFNYIQHYKKDAKVFNYFQEKPGGTAHDERRVRETILHSLPQNYNTVLDVGCGSAWVAKELLPKDKKVISLDLSFENVKKALDLYPSKKHSGLISDSFNLAIADNSIDLIIASEIIEHVVDPGSFVKELMRVLKPDGTLIITTPYKELLQYSLCIHCNKETPLHAHIHSFDEEILLSLYKEKDLKRIGYFTFGNKALIHLRMHVILKYLPYRLWRFADSFANFFIRHKIHIIVKYEKAI